MYVYKATNIINGKAYIGSSKQSLPDRISKHAYKAAIGTQRPLYEDMRRFGREVFRFEILAWCRSVKEMHACEKRLIGEHKTLVSQGGYNIAPDGTAGAGLIRTEQQRRDLTKAAKARIHGPHPSGYHFHQSLNQNRELIQSLRSEGLSFREIGDRIGCTASAIYLAMKRWSQTDG